MDLSKREINRYSRHLLLPEVGLEGQSRLKRAKVLCVGTGGLGSPLALYLAAAGVGRLGLVDSDVVDYSNLQRQVIHHTADIGKPKITSAAEKLRDLNPDIEIIEHETMLTAENAFDICSRYDIVADGTDNFSTRYLINDVCVLLGKPNVHASIFRFEGQASVFYAKEGPCYRCLYPEPPPPGEIPGCAEGGVLGVLPGLLGVVQATEVIKRILGIGDPLVGRLLMFDALGMRTSELRIEKDPDCPLCGTSPSITGLQDYQAFCGALAPGGGARAEIAAGEAAVWLGRPGDVLLLDVREPHEWDICRIAGAVHVPLGELAARCGELDPAKDIIVYCLMGARGRKALEILEGQGFHRVWNLRGGLRAWVAEVDGTLPLY
ncbi:molybdopterin-synthase adenylyltransferase MoeB [Azotobacter vinelandii]|uniref:molybdopterin-synthase adenylyltransferase MoeB n=1 Tax=Azotobacter vinelandii TaxID=354 RepID=UPI0007745D7A|nr:molybdopterin-synthase adenylyltransferase MoeB [Azotobacter vinelandii]